MQYFELRKNIFGRHILIRVLDDPAIYTILDNELSLYTNFGPERQPDITLEVGFELDSGGEVLAANPRNHVEFDDGFAINYGTYVIRWRFLDKFPRRISLSYKRTKKLGSLFQKMISIQYLNVKEAVGQIVHENILVPLSFFYDMAPVHASSIVSEDGKLLVFGGSGGVGKSSILILAALMKKLNYGFYSDDFLIVNSDGLALPNYAYPKIYAYNVLLYPQLKSYIFKRESWFSGIHWHIHKIRGLSKVRRRVAPDYLWNIFHFNGVNVKTYFILNRGNFEKITIVPLELDSAISATLNVVKAEYWSFINHVYWHNYNRNLLAKEPLITLEEVTRRWSEIYYRSFKNAEIFIINIPLSLPQQLFTAFFKDFLKTYRLREHSFS